jgi:hypothetical protein
MRSSRRWDTSYSLPKWDSYGSLQIGAPNLQPILMQPFQNCPRGVAVGVVTYPNQGDPWPKVLQQVLAGAGFGAMVAHLEDVHHLWTPANLSRGGGVTCK